MEEIFKDIPGYEGLYQVSNLGNVKSLPRLVKRKGLVLLKEKILSPGISSGGYFTVSLCINNKAKTKTIHKLVAITFLGHIPCGYELVIDHINNDKLDNRVENLQIVTHRFNVYKTKKTFSSKHKGVHWNKETKKWRSMININGKNVFLGGFTNEEEAHEAYQNKLKTI